MEQSPTDDATTDPRLRVQLDALAGERLSQFSVSSPSIRLAFWGAELATPSWEIVIEAETLRISTAETQPTPTAALSDHTVTTLLHALDHPLTAVDVDAGHLSLAFDDGLVIEVAPHQRFESWQITSSERLLIVCTPGGELTIWFPPPDRPPP